jgi:hypothetical protein
MMAHYCLFETPLGTCGLAWDEAAAPVVVRLRLPEATVQRAEARIAGDVDASGPVSIRSTAVVRGELRGSEISIEPGSRVSVRLMNDFDLDLGPSVAGAPAKRR